MGAAVLSASALADLGSESRAGGMTGRNVLYKTEPDELDVTQV